MFTIYRFYTLSRDVGLHELYYDNRWFIVQLTCSLTTCTCNEQQPNSSCFIVDIYGRRPRRARIVTCQQLFLCWHIGDGSSSSYTRVVIRQQLFSCWHIPQPCPNCRASVRLSHLCGRRYSFVARLHCLQIRGTPMPNLYSDASLRPSSQWTPHSVSRRISHSETRLFCTDNEICEKKVFRPFEVFLWNNKVRHVLISFIKVHLGKLIVWEILSC